MIFNINEQIYEYVQGMVWLDVWKQSGECIDTTMLFTDAAETLTGRDIEGPGTFCCQGVRKFVLIQLFLPTICVRVQHHRDLIKEFIT